MPVAAPVAPETPVKRKLTIALAAVQYEAATKAIQGLEPLRDEAKDVLLAYFERTGRAAYKDRIGWKWSGGGLILNQAAVREFLGDRLAGFQTRARRSRSLTLLKP